MSAKQIEANIQQLVSAGYSRTKSQKALKDAGNNLSKAREMLQRQKELEEAEKRKKSGGNTTLPSKTSATINGSLPMTAPAATRSAWGGSGGPVAAAPSSSSSNPQQQQGKTSEPYYEEVVDGDGNVYLLFPNDDDEEQRRKNTFFNSSSSGGPSPASTVKTTSSPSTISAQNKGSANNNNNNNKKVRYHPCVVQYKTCRYGVYCALRHLPGNACINYFHGNCIYRDHCRQLHYVDGVDIRQLVRPSAAPHLAATSATSGHGGSSSAVLAFGADGKCIAASSSGASGVVVATRVEDDSSDEFLEEEEEEGVEEVEEDGEANGNDDKKRMLFAKQQQQRATKIERKKRREERMQVPMPEDYAWNVTKGSVPSYSDPVLRKQQVRNDDDEATETKQQALPTPFLDHLRRTAATTTDEAGGKHPRVVVAAAASTPASRSSAKQQQETTSSASSAAAAIPLIRFGERDYLHHPCTYQCGSCKYGDACSHLQLPADVCVHYLNGRCVYEPNVCKYRHDQNLWIRADVVAWYRRHGVIPAKVGASTSPTSLLTSTTTTMATAAGGKTTTTTKKGEKLTEAGNATENAPSLWRLQAMRAEEELAHLESKFAPPKSSSSSAVSSPPPQSGAKGRSSGLVPSHVDAPTLRQAYPDDEAPRNTTFSSTSSSFSSPTYTLKQNVHSPQSATPPSYYVDAESRMMGEGEALNVILPPSRRLPPPPHADHRENDASRWQWSATTTTTMSSAQEEQRAFERLLEIFPHIDAPTLLHCLRRTERNDVAQVVQFLTSTATSSSSSAPRSSDDYPQTQTVMPFVWASSGGASSASAVESVLHDAEMDDDAAYARLLLQLDAESLYGDDDLLPPGSSSSGGTSSDAALALCEMFPSLPLEVILSVYQQNGNDYGEAFAALMSSGEHLSAKGWGRSRRTGGKGGALPNLGEVQQDKTNANSSQTSSATTFPTAALTPADELKMVKLAAMFPQLPRDVLVSTLLLCDSRMPSILETLHQLVDGEQEDDERPPGGLRHQGDDDRRAAREAAGAAATTYAFPTKPSTVVTADDDDADASLLPSGLLDDDDDDDVPARLHSRGGGPHRSATAVVGSLKDQSYQQARDSLNDTSDWRRTRRRALYRQRAYIKLLQLAAKAYHSGEDGALVRHYRQRATAAKQEYEQLNFAAMRALEMERGLLEDGTRSGAAGNGWIDNGSYRGDRTTTIDLHGFLVREALHVLTKRVLWCREQLQQGSGKGRGGGAVRFVRVIIGRGVHSVAGKSTILPAVIDAVRGGKLSRFAVVESVQQAIVVLRIR